MLTLTAELGLIDRYRAGRKDLLFLFPKIPHTKYKSKKKGVKEMTKTANEEWEIPGRQKVIRGLNVPVLTSHVGQNPSSKRASLSLLASLAALRAGYEREARVIKTID